MQFLKAYLDFHFPVSLKFLSITRIGTGADEVSNASFVRLSAALG